MPKISTMAWLLCNQKQAAHGAILINRVRWLLSQNIPRRNLFQMDWPWCRLQPTWNGAILTKTALLLSPHNTERPNLFRRGWQLYNWNTASGDILPRKEKLQLNRNLLMPVRFAEEWRRLPCPKVPVT